MSDAQVKGHRGQGVVIRGNDIDTDRIIPARYLAAVTFEGIEEGVFRDVRYTSDGQAKDHPFNEERHQNASVLVVNGNFGCGSSREHAPQALKRWGIQAIVGESFAEIFFGNCVALGMPVVTASPEHVAQLMDVIELDPAHEIHVDLERMIVTSRAGVHPVEKPRGARQQLLDGTWNALDALRSARDQIQATATRIPYIQNFRDGP